MSESQFERFAEAVNKLHFDGTWKQIYTLHHASGSHAHGSDHFLHWHRRFLYDVETLLQDAAKILRPDQDACEVTLPYWNWAEDYNLNHNCQEPEHAGDFYVFTCNRYGTLQRGDVIDGMFGWGTFDRKPRGRVSPATYAQVQVDVEDATHLDYTNFRVTLERYFHNSPHCNVGGTMCSFESPKDPLFFAHHTFIDRLWYTWQQKKAQTDSTGWKQSPTAPLEHKLCPADSDLPSAWVDSANLQGDVVKYQTRAEMSLTLSGLQLHKAGKSTKSREHPVDWETLQANVSAFVECCQCGLAAKGAHAAKAVIRDASGADICAMDTQSEYESDVDWCANAEGGSASDCKARAQAAVAAKAKQETKVPHCELSDPWDYEKQTCMALYSNRKCKNNMFDLCYKMEIKHEGSTDLCIPEGAKEYIEGKYGL